MAPDLKAKFTDLNDRVKLLKSCKPHYKFQLNGIESSLNKLLPVVNEIQVLGQDSSIRLKLWSKEVGDFEKQVSAGIQLCYDVYKEDNHTRNPVYGTELKTLSNSLNEESVIFKERKRTRVRHGAKHMLQKLDNDVQHLMRVKVHYSVVLTIIRSKLASLQVLVQYVEVIEEHNRSLNLSIAVVEDFRNVLSVGTDLTALLSKEPNNIKTWAWKNKLETFNNSLGTQVAHLTPPIK